MVINKFLPLDARMLAKTFRYTQREELAQNTQYIWAGSATPKRYHIETMEALELISSQ